MTQSGSLSLNSNYPPTYYNSNKSISATVQGTLTNGNAIGGTVLITGGAVQDAYDAGVTAGTATGAAGVTQSGSLSLNSDYPATFYYSNMAISVTVKGSLSNGNAIGGTVLVTGGAVRDAYNAGKEDANDALKLMIWDYNNNQWVTLPDGFDYTIDAGSWQNMTWACGGTWQTGTIRASSGVNVQAARHASGTFAYNMNIKVKVNGTVYTVQSQPLSASDWAAYNG